MWSAISPESVLAWQSHQGAVVTAALLGGTVPGPGYLSNCGCHVLRMPSWEPLQLVLVARIQAVLLSEVQSFNAVVSPL